MKELTPLLLAAFAAVTVENLFFSRGMGFDRILQSARRGREIGTFSLLIGLFSLLSGLIAGPLNRILPDSLWWVPVSAGVTAVCCLAVSLVTACEFPALYRKIGWCLAPAAVNTVVLSIPILTASRDWSPWQTAGFAIGTGFAFWCAAWLLAEMIPRFRHMSMPAAFRGMPAVFLYLAILVLAMMGFAQN